MYLDRHVHFEFKTKKFRRVIKFSMKNQNLLQYSQFFHVRQQEKDIYHMLPSVLNSKLVKWERMQ